MNTIPQEPHPHSRWASVPPSRSRAAHAATLAGVPMKDHHAKLMQTCETCHGTATPTERPDGKACIGCHGTMDKIPTKPNRFDKFPARLGPLREHVGLHDLPRRTQGEPRALQRLPCGRVDELQVIT